MNEKAKAPEATKPLFRVFYNYVSSTDEGKEILKRTSVLVRADGGLSAKLAAVEAIKADGITEFRITAIKAY